MFYLNGSEFNADYLIENLINGDERNLNFINKNFDFNVDIKKVHLDKNFKLQKFKGILKFKDNNIINADISAFFPRSKKI